MARKNGIKALVIEACKDPREVTIENPDGCGMREKLLGRIVVTGTADANGSLWGLNKPDLERIRKNVVGGVLCYDFR
jgi:hypothetical protein